MKRFLAIVAYDGTEFFGSQGQPDVRTVQGEFEKALERIFGQRVITQFAGRTDTGVHAWGQAVAFTPPHERFDTEIMKNALNANLPEDIYVRKVIEVDRDFNPRFRAVKRIYHYYIWNSTVPNLFFRRYTWWFPYKLDLSAMREATRVLEGEHDFSSFAKQPGNKNTIRTIYRIRILRNGNVLLIRVEGKAFLRRMVRNLVAALVKVGLKQWSIEDLKEVLESRDRMAASDAGSAPACGLVLYSVIF
ncbi:MAG: tRNA pseudouridine38-40 synthase [Thermotogota bacterium]|nr:tRNA pseudouridine38-40 synthase [Thermotogota bacterium]MDK2865443.1 tRNA pseudouridine38-40 synthase [Thermotogota bacterium]HCZ06211.1 tRNA pseudouridine(38-40) synthase TruA [Thermotogota bacterium]